MFVLYGANIVHVKLHNGCNPLTFFKRCWSHKKKRLVVDLFIKYIYQSKALRIA